MSSLTPLVFTYAYVTYQDIKQVGNLKDQTVIVVKAPTETKLEVPDPDEVREHILVGDDVEWMGFISGAVMVALKPGHFKELFPFDAKIPLPCGETLVTVRQEWNKTERALRASLSTLNSNMLGFDPTASTAVLG